MPLDPSIIAGLDKPDFLGALTRGSAFAAQQRNAPILDQLLQQKATQGEQQIQANEQTFDQNAQAQAIGFIQAQGRLAQMIIDAPDIESKRAILTEAAPFLRQFGVSDESIRAIKLNDDAALQRVVDRGQAFGGGELERSGVPFPVQLEGGGQAAAQVFTGPGGQVVTRNAPFTGTILDRKGQGAPERVAEAVETAEGTTQVEQDVILATQPEIAERVATAKKRGEGISTRQSGNIGAGLDAAKGVPVLKRTIELLDSVKTGGFEAARLRAKQFFGVEGADEGELSANLGQNVLADLRETFGAQFTEKEGERLERIRARFGASPATNRRLLQNAMDIALNAAERGINSAVAAKDFQSAADIQDLLSLELQAPELTPTGQTATNQETGEQVQEMSDGTWIPVSG